MDPISVALTAIPAVLNSPAWDGRIGISDLIDEDVPRLNSQCEFPRSLDVFREYAGTQAIAGRIGKIERFLVCLKLEKLKDWGKYFVVKSWLILGYVVDYHGVEEKPIL